MRVMRGGGGGGGARVMWNGERGVSKLGGSKGAVGKGELREL